MPRMTYEDAQAQMQSMKHLLYASKNINFWKFELLPAPANAPKTCVGVYHGVDKNNPEITQDWPIDEADIRHAGSIEARIKEINRGFASALAHLGMGIDRARAAQSRILLPRFLKHQGTRAAAFHLLKKGDHDH